MISKLLYVLVILLISLTSNYASSTDTSFACEFVENMPSNINPCLFDASCDVAYYATGDLDPSGEIINAKIGISNPSSSGTNYSHAFICKSDLEVTFNFEYKSDFDRCSENQFEFGFLNTNHNSKISTNYSLNNYNISVCLNTSSSDFGSLDVQIADERSSNLESIGFSCLYRFSEDPTISGLNAKTSSCSAQFVDSLGNSQQYPFLVYARLTPNIESSTCNQDCTSTLDGRVYQACGDTIQSCKNVPTQCDGSILGQWVEFDSNRDVLCQKDFNQFRSTVRTQEVITVDSQDNECQNIIVEKYTVQVEGEAVSMNIYICGDDN